MKLNPIAANMNEVKTDGFTILFSYKTPVACVDHSSEWFYRTSKKWSNTTTRHINKWLNGIKAIEKPQEYFDSLVGQVK